MRLNVAVLYRHCESNKSDQNRYAGAPTCISSRNDDKNKKKR